MTKPTSLEQTYNHSAATLSVASKILGKDDM